MTVEITFIPYEVAKKIVGAVMEEEHLQEPDRRILTVYDLSNKEICWFDAEEIMEELAAMFVLLTVESPQNLVSPEKNPHYL